MGPTLPGEKIKPRNEKEAVPPLPSRSPIMPGEEVYLPLEIDPNDPTHLSEKKDPGKKENDIYKMKEMLKAPPKEKPKAKKKKVAKQ